MNIYKIAIEDLTKTPTVDMSAEEMFEQRYFKYLEDLDAKARSSKNDPKEAETTYQEIKLVLKELDTISEKLEAQKDINNLRSKFEKILKKYFGSKYAKEHAKEKSDEVSKEDKNQQSDKNTGPENVVVSAPPPAGSQGAREMGLEGGSSDNIPSPVVSCKDLCFIKVSSTNVQYYTPEIILDKDLKKEVLKDYAACAINAIKHKHKNLRYKIDEANNEIKILDDNAIIKIKVNEYFNVSSIVPSGNLFQIYPYHSTGFYQKYWKPIVESIGHFCIGDPSVLLAVDNTTLPDVPKDCNASYALETWNIKNKKYETISISFKGDNPIWVFENISGPETVKLAQRNPSKYVETDYLNAIVKCIDPKLKSIYGRTGAAIQVIPLADTVEIDVDFGRGLGIVRLTEQQIEIVPLG